jgi:glycosyltransferase involved in cell wall biosynthesis
MKILILSTSERTGGAAVAANRLMHALNTAGHEAKMLVRDKQTDDANVISVNTSWLTKQINFLRFVWERFVIFASNRFSRKNLFAVSIANTGTNISKHPLVKEADIIHLHWINQGFLSLKNIKQLIALGKPVVWTMHDMWAFTGICHYAGICDKYKNKCECCQFLISKHHNDLAHKIWKQKQFLQDNNIQLVTVSNWLKNKGHESSLSKSLAFTVIPNVVDTTIFKPEDKLVAREKLQLPKDKKIILMGAANLTATIKGFAYLEEALLFLSMKNTQDYLLVLFGMIKNNETFLQNLSIPYIHLGYIQDAHKISELYQSADVTVVPSLYETFGQTISEGMACGCPSVSFNNSGQTDIIDHKINGYLAEYKNSEDLANGILWCLEKNETLSTNARQKVLDNYTENIVAQQYTNLYNKLLN